MPIEIRGTQPSVCIRRDAFEHAGLTRAALDERYSLTAEEFRVERDLVVVGPLIGEAITELFAELDEAGLEYFDDYFELSGNWPEWLTLYVTQDRRQ